MLSIFNYLQLFLARILLALLCDISKRCNSKFFTFDLDRFIEMTDQRTFISLKAL